MYDSSTNYISGKDYYFTIQLPEEDASNHIPEQADSCTKDLVLMGAIMEMKKEELRQSNKGNT